MNLFNKPNVFVSTLTPKFTTAETRNMLKLTHEITLKKFEKEGLIGTTYPISAPTSPNEIWKHAKDLAYKKPVLLTFFCGRNDAKFDNAFDIYTNSKNLTSYMYEQLNYGAKFNRYTVYTPALPGGYKASDKFLLDVENEKKMPLELLLSRIKGFIQNWSAGGIGQPRIFAKWLGDFFKNYLQTHQPTDIASAIETKLQKHVDASQAKDIVKYLGEDITRYSKSPAMLLEVPVGAKSSKYMASMIIRPGTIDSNNGIRMEEKADFIATLAVNGVYHVSGKPGITTGSI